MATLLFTSCVYSLSQDALCDVDADVREAAAKAFSTLQHTVGVRAVDEILPSLLSELTCGNATRAARATFGLRGILAQKSKDVRIHIH